MLNDIALTIFAPTPLELALKAASDQFAQRRAEIETTFVFAKLARKPSAATSKFLDEIADLPISASTRQHVVELLLERERADALSKVLLEFLEANNAAIRSNLEDLKLWAEL